MGSWARIASRTASEIWSQSLSGCPSVTDSLVKNDFGLFIKLLKVSLLLSSFLKTREHLYCSHEWRFGELSLIFMVFRPWPPSNGIAPILPLSTGFHKCVHVRF